MVAPRVCLAVALAVLTVRPGACAAAEITFAPHRAIYDVTLSRSAAGSGVNDMKGRLVYELTGGGCEDFNQTMRFVTQSSQSDGSEQINDMRTTTLEEIAGRRMTFSTTQYRDEQVAEVTEGNAGRKGPAGEVTIQLVRPESKALSLPATTYFPIQHSIALLAAAKSGKSRFEADVYDGSEKGDKVSATNTVIGKVRTNPETELTAIASATKMKDMPYWPIATSYFDKAQGIDSKDSVPTYEMSAHFYENGVSTRLLMDYGDFALKGELKELTFLAEPKCGK